MLDPAVSATIAATGLYLREGNSLEDLASAPGRVGSGNLRQRSVVLDLLGMWHPFLGFEDLFGALTEWRNYLYMDCVGGGRPTCMVQWHRASGVNAWSNAPWSLQLCQAYVSEHPQDPMRDWMQQWDVMPAHDVVCRACGDNTIGHWTRWCVVPLIVAIAILKPDTFSLSLGHLACQNPRHAAICTLILANFRRLLRQEGAFLHQRAAEPKSVVWWTSKLHEMVARDAHVQLQVQVPVSCGSQGRCSL